MYGMGWQRQINPHYIPLNERQVKTVVKKAQEQKIMERRKEEGGRRKEDVVQDVVTDVVPGHYCEV
tara:strand:+ start:242 stop:439 length:198 start_codon:yes stop_codon:yes gene_type:complete